MSAFPTDIINLLIEFLPKLSIDHYYIFWECSVDKTNIKNDTITYELAGDFIVCSSVDDHAQILDDSTKEKMSVDDIANLIYYPKIYYRIFNSFSKVSRFKEYKSPDDLVYMNFKKEILQLDILDTQNRCEFAHHIEALSAFNSTRVILSASKTLEYFSTYKQASISLNNIEKQIANIQKTYYSKLLHSIL